MTQAFLRPNKTERVVTGTEFYDAASLPDDTDANTHASVGPHQLGTTQQSQLS